MKRKGKMPDALGYNEDELVCYGCAHSASRVAFPGKPSGERPCQFCVRNKDLALDLAAKSFQPAWYDGSKPVKVPMDCYQTLDMQQQHLQWSADLCDKCSAWRRLAK